MKMKRIIQENGLHVSWAIALIATMGSLYFSEVSGYIPCKLCWYQRILMYPLVIILGIAAARKHYSQVIYVLPFSIMGMLISAYHFMIQKTEWIKGGGSSCGVIPCNTQYINWLGFVTIPLLALIAFTLIACLQILLLKYAKGQR